MEREEIIRKLERVLEEGSLDDDVHNLKSEEASKINNGGISAQLDYLESNGFNLHEMYLSAIRWNRPHD